MIASGNEAAEIFMKSYKCAIYERKLSDVPYDQLVMKPYEKVQYAKIVTMINISEQSFF